MSTLGLRTRLLLAFAAPTLALWALGGWSLYRSVQTIFEESLGESLSTVAAAISTEVKAERVLALTPDDAVGEGSRTFRSLMGQVHELQKATGLRRILIFDAQRRARLDVGGVLPLLAEVPESFQDTLELQRVFEGQRAASQVLFEGTDGLWYKRGYAPMFVEGQVVGAVAVEGPAEFFGPLTSLRNAFLGLGAATFALLFFAAALSASALSRPLERLVASALRMGRGDLETPVIREPTVEIGILAGELEAMRRALQSRNRQLTMMLAGVAHEVKNPLGGIELFAGLLDEELRSPELSLGDARAHLQRIRREVEYLKRIVDDFLAFAKDDKLQRTRFDAQRWVECSLQHVQGEATVRGVDVYVQAQSADLEGDENLLISALVNVLKNAVQISKPGQRVTVVGASHETESSYTVEVRDEGPGIAPEVQPRLFEPFFTTREQGTGLGLPLARKILEAHRGHISLVSSPGSTVFTLEVPRPTETS